MKKFAMVFAVLVLTLTTGCGTWCSKDREYCIEGFSGMTRYHNYSTVYYYPATVFTVSNDLKKSCTIDVIVDGIVMSKGIQKGQFKRIEIKSPPNENRPATVLIKRYCGKKSAGSYTNLIQLSSTHSATYAWLINERHFSRR